MAQKAYWLMVAIRCDLSHINSKELEGVIASHQFELKGTHSQLERTIFVWTFKHSKFEWISVKVCEMEDIVEKIRARIASVDPNGPRKVKGVFQLNIKSNDGSTRPITLDLNKLEVHDGNVHDSPDVSVDFDTDTLAQVAKNEISFGDAIQSGKVTLTGNAELAETFGHVVSSKPIE